MKRLVSILVVISATISLIAGDIPAGYVDLGLPSGTLWKAESEQGHYTYLSAKYYFGEALPNRAQVRELLYNCTRKWTGKGYRVTGPNQNSIYFRFEGYLDCDEDLHKEGSAAVLWTMDNAGSSFAYAYILTDRQRDILEESNCWGCTVRLVISE